MFPFESFNYDMGNFWAKYMADISSTSSVFLENTLHQKLYNTQFYFADKQPGIPFMISPAAACAALRRPTGVRPSCSFRGICTSITMTRMRFGNITAR